MKPVQHHYIASFFATFTLLLVLLAASQVSSTAAPVKIYILAGQSNMLGKGEISPVTTPGTLDYIVANDPDGRYQFLKSGGSYVVRDDVWIRDQDPVKGGLTTGYGGEAGGLIGPELGFGHKMGDVDESQILIVKCAWGGKDLAGDFRPPSSGWTVNPPVTAGQQGFYYKEILRLVNEATTNLGTYFPEYDGGGYEIAGVCWHQGWNDRIDVAKSAAYEANMVNFINDLRSDLGVPNLPFVIATTGQDGLSGYGYTAVEKAQLKMADTNAYPAFAGNVAVVDTRGTYDGLDFWQSGADSPAVEGFHWNRNAKTYLHIGLAMGDAMSLLAPGRSPYRARASGGPGGVTLTWQNGTEIPSSVRVLRNGLEIAAAAPANPASFVDAAAPLGVNSYELQFTMPGDAAPPLTLSHNTGITDLQARSRINGINLSWQNNLGYTAVKVTRNGSVIAAALAGSATSYVDRTPPAGLVTYIVEPTDAGTTPAEVQTTVSAAPRGTAVIYEPFDMTAATPLNGKDGGIGLDGQWVAGSEVQVTSGNFTFGSLPVYGNRIVRTSSSGSATINIGNSLADAGLMDDGAELWFSFLCPNPNNTSANPTMVLSSENLTNSTTVAQSGSAIGAKLDQGKTVQGLIFDGGGAVATSATQATLVNSELALVVGRIIWGANPSLPDTIEIYTPGTNLVLDTPQSASAVVDQSTFRVLSMWGSATAPNLDEIRFGATYQDVIGQGIDTTGDLTAPTPATMSFASLPTAISDAAITMTATTASDANGVRYRFICTAGGGHSSAWQDSPVYTDTGLTPDTLYSYSVQARDKSANQNTNTASLAVAATTNTADSNPPPTPGFSSPPAATSPTAITMTASAVIDPEGAGVQYYFDETSGNPGGEDSGWQDSLTYADSGLTPNTQYTYRVKARDKAAVPNESALSTPANATTQAAPNGISGTWAFDSDGNWSETGKWSGGTVAGFANSTATFPNVFSTARTVTLDTPVTIGNLTCEDTNTDLNFVGGNTLTLAVTTGTPVIDIAFRLYITNVIAGSNGLRKNGAGYLSLSGANTYSGSTIVSAGMLDLGNISLSGFSGGSGRNISVTAGANVRRNTLDNAFLNRMVETTDEIGVFTGATSNNVDFSSSTGANLPNAFFGNWAGNGSKCEYNGTLTPANDAYRLGFPGANGLLGMRQPLTGARSLIVGGGRVQLVNAGNTFSGDTVIRTGAKLTLGNNLALQNSALDVGAAGGSFALNNLVNNISGSLVAASPTFGGLKGSRALYSVFTTTGGNNETNLAATAVSGFSLNVGTGKSCTYSGAIGGFGAGASGGLNGSSTLTKTGLGTQTLSGANTYSGATSVNQGTLALVGGSHKSPITVATGASLGFTLGSPTTSTSSVNLTNGTVKISGSVDNSSDYLLMTATTITGTPVLNSPIPGYELQKTAGNTQLTLVHVGGVNPYDTWSGSAAFDDDTNGDGVKNGLAWMLGAATKDANAIGLLPAATQSGGNLVLTFKCLKAAKRGTAVPKVQYSKDLGATDLWAGHGDAVIPEVSGTVAGVAFVITADGNPDLWNVQATIPASAASPGTKLFGRINAVSAP